MAALLTLGGLGNSWKLNHVQDLRVEPTASFLPPLKASSVPLHVSRQVVGVLVAFHQVGVAGRVLIGEGFKAVCGEIVRSRLKKATEVTVSVVWVETKEQTCTDTHKKPHSHKDSGNESLDSQAPTLRLKIKVQLSATPIRKSNLLSTRLHHPKV